MASHAYVKLVPASEQQTVTLDDVKDLLQYYREITTKTGEQLSWHYGRAAFPYEFAETRDGKGKWFYLRSTDPENFRYIVFAVDTDEAGHYVQITLPDDATHGDKGKANEYGKFIAKKLKGELHLFNDRIMFYHDQKT